MTSNAAAKRDNAAPFPVGTRVRCVTDAEYAGMEGRVISIHGPNRQVRFDPRHMLPDLLFRGCELEEVR